VLQQNIILHWKYWTSYTCSYPVKLSAKLYVIFFFVMVLYDNVITMLNNYFIFIVSGAGDATSCRWVTEWQWPHWRDVDTLENNYREIFGYECSISSSLFWFICIEVWFDKTCQKLTTGGFLWFLWDVFFE